MGNEHSDLIETTKWWKYIKWLPVVNILYGCARFGVYALKKNDKEALDSVIAAAGGALGVAVSGFACGLISAPLAKISEPILRGIVHFAVEMIAGGVAQNVIIGGGDILLMHTFEPEKLKNLNSDQIEKLIYDNMAKDIPIVGALYSLPRAGVYSEKGIADQRDESLCSAWANGLGAAAGLMGASIAQQLAPHAVKALNISLKDDIGRGVSYLTQEGLIKLGHGAGHGVEKITEKLILNADKVKYL